jgi:hypothetical protein
MSRLSEIVRAKMDAGVLAVDRPVKLWAGRGQGHACAVCAEPIVDAQTEYEVQYDDGSAIKFHIECHSVWEEERRRRSES